MRSHSMLAALILGFAAAVGAISAEARSWYPAQCATVDYCAPVQSALIISIDNGAPQLLVASDRGRVIVPKDFPIQLSDDERLHVCLRYDPFGSLEVTCLFVPVHAF